MWIKTKLCNLAVAPLDTQNDTIKGGEDIKNILRGLFSSHYKSTTDILVQDSISLLVPGSISLVVPGTTSLVGLAYYS